MGNHPTSYVASYDPKSTEPENLLNKIEIQRQLSLHLPLCSCVPI